jgi:hypothetical protein
MLAISKEILYVGQFGEFRCNAQQLVIAANGALWFCIKKGEVRC